jgi:hypothetical protein
VASYGGGGFDARHCAEGVHVYSWVSVRGQPVIGSRRDEKNDRNENINQTSQH